MLYLPVNLTALDAYVFRGIHAQAVALPAGRMTVAADAFTDCDELLYIFVPTLEAEQEEALNEQLLKALTGSTNAQIVYR